MKCPHCLTEFHDHPKLIGLQEDVEGWWGAIVRVCPACSKAVIDLVNAANMYFNQKWHMVGLQGQYLVRPKSAARLAPSPEVPKEFAGDYVEACLVAADSPKASAALSRRCLQHLLREKAAVKHSDLFSEIDEVLKRGTMPSHISESLDAVRNIGNFAAHPIKSKSSGEIVPVEPGEAEWNLDTLEALFDYYFVQPAITKRKKAALDKKLQDAGKPPTK